MWLCLPITWDITVTTGPPRQTNGMVNLCFQYPFALLTTTDRARLTPTPSYLPPVVVVMVIGSVVDMDDTVGLIQWLLGQSGSVELIDHSFGSLSLWFSIGTLTGTFLLTLYPALLPCHGIGGSFIQQQL